MKIGIHRWSDLPLHTNSWSAPWEACCQREGLAYEVVDLLLPGAIRRVHEFDVLLYHFSNARRSDLHHARSILRAARAAGVHVFPDDPDAWHFDDKVAQAYLLEALGAPIPHWEVFHSRETFDAWLEEATFPFVVKLRSGSGSHHVHLIEDRGHAERYASQMFGPGIQPRPNLAFKASSNIRSVRSIGQFLARARRVPEFLRTRRAAKQFDAEQGYVYVQEFIPNDGYDVKVAVVNGKTSFFARHVRPGDFRASGGGDFFHDRSMIPESVVAAAQETAAAMGSTCMGFDFVVEKGTQAPKIVEMSYGFSHRALLEAGGHWDARREWVSEPLNAPEEVLMGLLTRVETSP